MTFYGECRACKAYISGYLDKDLSLTSVAARFHYHPAYFSALFKRSVGPTFSEYILNLRMAEAGRMLKETSLFASKIGERVGYASAAYFTKAFKKQYGLSPDQYRKHS